ncbi:23828_t:CDS:2, partial [Dentiscutata erythropus]
VFGRIHSVLQESDTNNLVVRFECVLDNRHHGCCCSALQVQTQGSR